MEDASFIGIQFLRCNSQYACPVDVVNANVTISSSVFDELKGKLCGVIAAHNSRLSLESMTFHKNEAKEGGAVVALKGSKVTVLGCTFDDNESTDENGSAITILEEASAIILDSSFTRNRANYGGAIFASSSNAAENVVIDLLHWKMQ